jgi:hypothetical protein
LALDSDRSAMGTTSALLQCRWLGFQLEHRIGTGDMVVLAACITTGEDLRNVGQGRTWCATSITEREIHREATVKNGVQRRPLYHVESCARCVRCSWEEAETNIGTTDLAGSWPGESGCACGEVRL